MQNERVPFLEERLLAPEEDLFGSPRHAGDGTLYEHCVRALDLGTTSGPRGLPKMGAGDWNDGMNRVGRRGQGESVWLGWFPGPHARGLRAPGKMSGDHARAATCGPKLNIRRAVEAEAWDGDWYRRAYYDDGTPIGSREARNAVSTRSPSRGR